MRCNSLFDSGKSGLGVEQHNIILIYFLSQVAALYEVLQYQMKLAFFWFILIQIWFIFAYFLSESDLFLWHLDGNTADNVRLMICRWWQ